MDRSRGNYNTHSDIRFKTTMLNSSLYDYSYAYILARGRITITGDAGRLARKTEAQLSSEKQADERNKGVTFKNGAPLINCKSKINNAEIDNAKDIDMVIPMYKLMECNDNYSKTFGSLWQYYKDVPNDNLADSESFKSKMKITGNTPVDGNTKHAEILGPLINFSNFWRTIEMPLINCEVNLILTWSSNCVITNCTSERRFPIFDTTLCVPLVTLSTQDTAKLLQQLKSSFKRTIDWNKYQSVPKTYRQSRHLNHLVHPIFQEVNRLFVLYFENEDARKSHSEYYLQKVEIKDYNVMINGRIFFDQPINDGFKTSEKSLENCYWSRK